MKFRIFKDVSGQWRWRLVARNGKIIADSGEGYRKASSCKSAIDSVVKNIQAGRYEVVRA